MAKRYEKIKIKSKKHSNIITFDMLYNLSVFISQ